MISIWNGKTAPSVKNAVYTLMTVLLIVVAWKILSLVIAIPIIMPSPEQTIRDFLRILKTALFRQSALMTIFRGMLGFSAAFVIALIVGILAGRYETFRAVIRPGITTIRSTPVISVILLAMIWFTSGGVPVFVGFLMAFPILYGNTVEGMRNIDAGLVEMAHAFEVSRSSIVRHIYLPSLVPYILAGASTGLGITWKAVIAAEVLSMPLRGIGTGLQNAKIVLETGEVFAWTLVAILLGELSESVVRLAGKRHYGRIPRVPGT